MTRKTFHIDVKQPVFPFGKEYLPDNSQAGGTAFTKTEEGKLLAMTIKNVLPTEYGLTSFFGEAVTDIHVPVTTEYILLVRSEIGNNILVALGIFGAMFTVDGITWDKTQSPVADRDILNFYTSGTLTIPSLSATANPATSFVDGNASISGVTGQVNAVITITDQFGTITTQQLALNIDPVTYEIVAVDTGVNSTIPSTVYSLSGITPEGGEEIIGVANVAGSGIIRHTITLPAAKTWLDNRGSNFNPWSYATVSNDFYCYRQGLGNFLKLDIKVTPEVWAIVNPTFLNMPTTVGIFGARSRLGAWDTTNAIFTSAPLTVSDFKPSLDTQANTVTVDALIGRIINVLPITNGFIIYATSSIILAQYSPTSRVSVFHYTPISKSEGIAHRHAAIEADTGTHYAHTGSGLQQVTRRGLVDISVEASSYIDSSVVSPRLTWVQGRYIVIDITPGLATGTLKYKTHPGVPIVPFPPFDPGTPTKPAPVPPLPPLPINLPATEPVLCPAVTDKVIQVTWQLMSLTPEELEPNADLYGYDVSTNKGALDWYGVSGIGSFGTSNRLLLGVTPVTQWIHLTALPLVIALQTFINESIVEDAHKYISMRANSPDIFDNLKNYQKSHPTGAPFTSTFFTNPPGVNANHVDYDGITGTVTNYLLMDFGEGIDYYNNVPAIYAGAFGTITETVVNVGDMATNVPDNVICGTPSFDFSSLSLSSAEAAAIIGALGIDGKDAPALTTDSYLTSTGSTEPVTPVYSRGLILDTQLKNWGSYDKNHRLMVDYSPINFRSFNPITGITSSKFTFQNLAKTFVVCDPNGELFLSTQTNTEALAEFGNVAYTRTGVTRMLDALVELATYTGAIFEIKNAEGKIIVSSTQPTIGELAVYKVLASKYFTLIIRGEFTLKGMDFSGEPGGNR